MKIKPSALFKIIPHIVLGVLPIVILWKGGKAIDATWLVSTLAVVLLLDMYMRRVTYKKSLPKILTYALLVFCGTTILSWLYSEVQNYGFDEVLHTISLCVVLFWTTMHFSSLSQSVHKKYIQQLSFVIVASFLVAIGIGMLVYVLQPVNRFVGSFFDARFHTDYWPNAWAQLCVLFLPISIWLLVTTMRNRRITTRVVLYGLMSFCVAALLLSYSRGALIASFGQIAVWCGLYACNTLPKKRIASLLKEITCVVAVAVGIFIGVNAVRGTQHAVESVQSKVTFTADEGKISINERAQFWEQSLELIPRKPMFGYGPYAFRFVQPALQNDVLATSDHPHNVFLKIALERGVIALLAFSALLAGILVSFTYVLLFKRKQAPNLAKNVGFYTAVYISVLGVTAHNLIDYNLQFMGIAFPYFMALGVLGSVVVTTKKSRLLILTPIIALVLVSALFREGLYLVQSSIGRGFIANAQYEQSIPYLQQSTGQWFSRDVHISLMDAFILTNQPGQALDVFDEYRTINIHDSRSWKLRGDACRALQFTDCALQSYSKAWELSPFNDIAPLRWYLQTLVDIDDKASLDANLTEVDNTINKYQYAIMHGVHHIGLSQNVEELIGLLELLATKYPERRQFYIDLQAKIDERAKKDREFVAGRKPGVLW